MANTAAAPKGAKDTMTIKLPLSREKQEDVFVSCNGMNLLIQRGKEVEVPMWAYEILQNKEAMESLALERQQNLPNR